MFTCTNLHCCGNISKADTSGLQANQFFPQMLSTTYKSPTGDHESYILKPSGGSQRSDWYRSTSVLEELADSSNAANGYSTFLQHLSNNLSIQTTISHDTVHRLEFFFKEISELRRTSMSVAMKRKFPTWLCSLAYNWCRFLGRSSCRSDLAEAILDARRSPK